MLHTFTSIAVSFTTWADAMDVCDRYLSSQWEKKRNTRMILLYYEKFRFFF